MFLCATLTRITLESILADSEQNLTKRIIPVPLCLAGQKQELVDIFVAILIPKLSKNMILEIKIPHMGDSESLNRCG